MNRAVLLLAFGFLTSGAENDRNSLQGQVGRAAESNLLTEQTGKVDTVPVVLSISGGISKGSYQAGVNWALIRFYRRTQDKIFRDALSRVANSAVEPHRLEVVTGASAGNINGLLSALEWCRSSEQERPPEESHFWDMWVPTGWEQLYPPDSVRNAEIAPSDTLSREAGFFHRAFYRERHYPRLRTAIDSVEYQPRCSVPVGITLTRLSPEPFRVEGTSIDAMTQRVVAIFEVRSASSGKGVVFEQPNDSTLRNPSLGTVILLPPAASTRIHPSSVFAAVEASSAFPVAFSPKRLAHVLPTDLAETGLCIPASDGRCPPPRIAEFTDGGVFDNNPLDLALGLHRHYGESDTHSPRVIYIDPDATREPLKTLQLVPRVVAVASPRGISALQQLAGGLIPSARQYELHSLIRTLRRDSVLYAKETDRPYGRESWLSTTDRAQPLISEHLGSFAGFLGRPFREYDFYVGVYDGLHFAARDGICHTAPKDDCIAASVFELIEGSSPADGAELMNLGYVAPPILAELYKLEYPRRVAPTPPGDTVGIHFLQRALTIEAATVDGFAVRDSVASTAVWAAEVIDEARMKVLLSLVRAQGVMFEPEVPFRCVDKALVERILCDSRFDEVLSRFATDSVLQIVSDWQNQQGCGVGAMTAPATCRADRTLYRLLLNPGRQMDRLLIDILRQMQHVEQAEKHFGRGRESMIELTEWMYRSVALRPTGAIIDPVPSTVPAYAPVLVKAPLWLVPNYMAVSLAEPGIELGWRPAVNLYNLPIPVRMPRIALLFPLGIHVNRTPPDGQDEIFLRFGTGVLHRYESPLISALEGSYQNFSSWDGEDSNAHALEMAGYLLGGKIRFGVRRFIAGNPTSVHNAASDWGITLGLSDLPGILYWAARLAK